jgi:hypothetical protein
MLGVLLVLLAQVEPATKPPPAADVTPRMKAILAKLEEPVAVVFPKKVTLDEVLQHIQRATKNGPNDPGIPIYIDPLGLQRAARSLNTTVTINEKSLPLKDSLARVLTSLGMAYIVKDDVLIISDPRGIERERNEVGVRGCDASPATKALLARLEEVERSLNSTIGLMDLEGVPLKTTLRLMLDQLGLACVVKDGRLVIHSRKGIQKLLRNATGEPGSRDAPASS